MQTNITFNELNLVGVYEDNCEYRDNVRQTTWSPELQLYEPKEDNPFPQFHKRLNEALEFYDVTREQVNKGWNEYARIPLERRQKMRERFEAETNDPESELWRTEELSLEESMYVEKWDDIVEQELLRMLENHKKQHKKHSRHEALLR